MWKIALLFSRHVIPLPLAHISLLIRVSYRRVRSGKNGPMKVYLTVSKLTNMLKVEIDT